MAYWIVGLGGIGSTFGARLAKAHDVVFVDTWDDNVAALQRDGLTVEYPDATVHVKPPAFAISDLAKIGDPPDAVFLTVKSFQTREVAQQLAAVLGSDTPVVSLQNCLNGYTLAEVLGEERVVGGMVRFDGYLREPGHATATRTERRSAIGELRGAVTPRIDALQQVMSASVHTDATDNIWGSLWGKLTRNSGVNPVSVVSDLGMGEIVASDAARKMAVALGRETVAVATGLGIVIDPKELDGPQADYFEAFGSPAMDRIEGSFRSKFERYPAVRTSMWQDIRRGRRTEIGQMNGQAALKGREVGVPTPLHDRFVELVGQVEGGERVPDKAAVEVLFPDLLREHASGRMTETRRQSA